eukprot:CAMPEP_0172913432 /NCGR_PEP_ID=MMETSP1075-20121228/190357_1 /TAXON_ID=2916 /ORGANISM="Ceratium fusus, Strain PA161109" /LENGTH=78 /DNA_ID=CAMNT_0013772141 /DNA_START=49 /DNA_END=281 /DNA_ORIENTATION=+
MQEARERSGNVPSASAVLWQQRNWHFQWGRSGYRQSRGTVAATQEKTTELERENVEVRSSSLFATVCAMVRETSANAA